MVGFVALPVFLCVMGLFSESLCFVTLEVEVGDNVTIWCRHELIVAGFIRWFKHTCGSAPLIIGCKKFFESVPSQNCLFFNESEHMVVSVQGENTSLTITAVNVSDTGLYYCSSTDLLRITFHETNYLRVKGGNKTLSKISDRETVAAGSVSLTLIFVLTAVFGSVIVILLSVLIFILLKHRNTHGGHKAEDTEDPESDSVNYAALNFSKMKTKKAARLKRQNTMEDPHVVYSSARHYT